jgi:hypothetical protein
MTRRKRRGRFGIYHEWSKQLRDQLVRGLDGNYYKIMRVDGFGQFTVHLVTQEGKEFWAMKDSSGRYFEIPPEL